MQPDPANHLIATPRGATRTGVAVTMLRAAHQLIDGEPRILDDPVAALLLGDDAVTRILDAREDLMRPELVALRSHVVLRSRYAEDHLREAVARGITQYVILGAGFDSFAYRQPEWARGITIFEVDHAESQRAKRDALASAAITPPSNVIYAVADFAQQSLRDVLALAGFDFSRPALFSCLGVLVYLETTAVQELFAFVGSLPRTTELVFTFTAPEADGSAVGTLAERAAALGEPWLSRLTAAQVDAMLRAAGFSHVEFPAIDDIARRYYRNRTDSLLPPRRTSIGCAIV